MKYYALLIFQFLILHGLNAQIWLVDPLEAIYPDQNDLSSFDNTWKADFPLGTEADVHVLLNIPIGSVFEIVAKKNGIPLNNIVWNELIDVPVEQNTGLDSRTEQF
ncbi:MAG: hypothetical protein HKP42_10325, partial [Maribacter sp.]|nr:hypothetical protein [Maribacter sp.]